MSAIDVVRSLLRTVADRALSRAQSAPPVVAARKLIASLKEQRAIIPEGALSAVAAHADGISAATVTCRDGRIFVDATLSAGRDVHFSLIPKGVFFAPRGAKEIVFQVEPPEEAGRARNIISTIAGCIAQTIWPMILRGQTSNAEQAIVESDREGTMRVDLRTLPSVRAMMARGAQAMILDVLALDSIIPEPGQLALKLKLPQLVP